MTVYSCHKELKVEIYATIFVPDDVLCGYSVGSRNTDGNTESKRVN